MDIRNSNKVYVIKIPFLVIISRKLTWDCGREKKGTHIWLAAARSEQNVTTVDLTFCIHHHGA